MKDLLTRNSSQVFFSMSQSLVAYRMDEHGRYSDLVGFYNWNLVEVLDQNEGVFSRLSIATYPT